MRFFIFIIRWKLRIYLHKPIYNLRGENINLNLLFIHLYNSIDKVCL